METIKKIFTNKEVLKKIAFTLFIFLIFKLLTKVTVPLVNQDAFSGAFESGFLGIANSLSGGALRNYSVVALGISPYITASIVVQLLQMDIVPFLKEWSEEGEIGKKKISRFTRYLAIGLAFIQAIAMTFAFDGANIALFNNQAIEWATVGGRNLWFIVYFYIAVVLTAGTALMIWLADQITIKGIGNGTSMLIVAGIIISFPGTIVSLVQYYIADPNQALAGNVFASQGAFSGYLLFAISVLMFVLVLVGVTYMQIAVRKVPIQYANRPGSSKFAGKSESNIPIKLNTAGVIPVIFASIILSLPLTIIGYISGGTTTQAGGVMNWIQQIFTYTEPIGFVLYVLLIFIFTFFYSFILVKPEQIAENLNKQNAYIPGVRPGKETEAHITKTLFRVTVVGAFYLAVVASLPIITSIVLGHNYAQIGGTSLLIIVGVALETARQIEADTQEKAYAGFMR
jgi:preprotein translocase subunit SecY